ncbi:MAG: hypothetical protein OXB86_04645 [Bdellovibrionales bacterium]|nr:hypothetical protein [Bdellovibrionales bacterium]
MRNICLFISIFLMSFVVHAETNKVAALEDFLTKIYGPEVSEKNASLQQVTEEMQKYLLTCPLKADLTKPDGASAIDDPVSFSTSAVSSFLEAVSCDQIIDRAKASSLSRFKMSSLIIKLGEETGMDEARQEELLDSLEEIYGPESSQKAQERKQLISHFQNCEQNFNTLDSLAFWSDAFGCEEIIKTAKEAGISGSEVQESIEAALPEGSEIANVPSTKPKKRQRTSKP